MIFDTIPEPLVTLQEVRSILEKLFLPSANNEEVIEIFCEWFEKLMPESTTLLKPRTLRHLCRCVVRDNIRRNGKFPYGVYSLTVPESLQEYILLEKWCSSDSFKSEKEELSFFVQADTTIPSLAQQFFNRRNGQGTPMLSIMAENFQREIDSKLVDKKRNSV